MEVINIIFSSVIVVIMPLLFVKIIGCELKSKISKIIATVLVSIMLYIITYKYSYGIYRSLYTFAISTFSIYYCYKITIKQAIISSVLLLIVLMIPDFLFLYTLTNILGFSKDYCYNVISGSFISNFVICIIMVIITVILRKQLNKIIKIQLTINKKIVIFSILTLISSLVFFYDIIASFRVGTKIIFYIIAIITFVIALIIVIYQESKNSKLKTEYNKLLEFMETYEVELEQQRILKHEYKKIANAIVCRKRLEPKTYRHITNSRISIPMVAN